MSVRRFPESSNLAVLRSRTRVAFVFLISSRRRMYEKEEEEVVASLIFCHSTIFCHSEIISESSILVSFCHSVGIPLISVFFSDTISSVLLLPKVPKASEVDKLAQILALLIRLLFSSPLENFPLGENFCTVSSPRTPIILFSVFPGTFSILFTCHLPLATSLLSPLATALRSVISIRSQPSGMIFILE